MDNDNLTQLNDIKNFFLNSTVDISLTSFILSIIISVILAYIIKFTYLKNSQTLSNKLYFSDQFIPLAAVTCLVITVIKFSLALSLGLVGALSIVRFRAAIKEPEEIAYLFLCIAIGLGLGANYTLITVTGFAIILALTIVVNLFSKKSLDNEEMFCTISLNKEFVLEELLSVLKKHSNYLFLRDFDINNEFSQVGLIINFKNSNSIMSLSEELNRIYPGVNIKFLNKQALS